MTGSAAPLPPPPAVSEVADITAMLLAHPQGYQNLLRVLEGMAAQHKKNYDAAAQAVVLGGNHSGVAAKSLGAQQGLLIFITTLQNIQIGKLK